MPKLVFEFNPFSKSEAKLSRSAKAEAAEEIRNYIKEQVLADIGEGSSPVRGGSWKKSLSPDYKAVKSSQSSTSFANLELIGEMLDALDVKIISGNRMSLEVAASQAKKADGNNRGTYGKGTRTNLAKARTFIPYKQGQTLSDEIWDGINSIISEFEDE